MTGFLLDTNVISELRKGSRADARVLDWLGRADENSLYVSMMTIGELHNGLERAARSPRRSELFEFVQAIEARFLTRTFPVSSSIARRWGVVGAQSSLRGRPVQVVDALIAATALEHDVTVATRNVRDFDGLGVRVLNPFES